LGLFGDLPGHIANVRRGFAANGVAVADIRRLAGAEGDFHILIAQQALGLDGCNGIFFDDGPVGILQIHHNGHLSVWLRGQVYFFHRPDVGAAHANVGAVAQASHILEVSLDLIG
jgi:hypothetical protein